MKLFRTTLAVMTIGTVMAGTFAFTPRSVNKQATTGDFYVNADGSAGDPINPMKACPNLNANLCSQQYNIVDGEPTTATGQHKLNGPRPQ
jgi:hypothetical protein